MAFIPFPTRLNEKPIESKESVISVCCRNTIERDFMQSPVDRLRDAVKRMPEKLSSILVYNGCIAIGRAPLRSNNPYDANRPAAERYQRLTVDDLCDQITQLIELGMMEEFIIPAILNYVIAEHERIADKDVANEILDNSLSTLQRLELQLSLPVNLRSVPVSDDALVEMIEMFKEGMLRQPKAREEFLDIADSLREFIETTFPRQYWREWEQHYLRSSLK